MALNLFSVFSIPKQSGPKRFVSAPTRIWFPAEERIFPELARRHPEVLPKTTAEIGNGGESRPMRGLFDRTAAQQSPTRICSQTFNEHLGRGQVEFRFQQKRPEKLLTIQFLPSDTTPFHLRCHEAVWTDYFNSPKEICQFPCNFYSKFSFQLLKKVRFDANVMIQLIVHVTPLVWRKMNFQLTFFKFPNCRR